MAALTTITVIQRVWHVRNRLAGEAVAAAGDGGGVNDL
jgi:hypothetical protein